MQGLSLIGQTGLAWNDAALGWMACFGCWSLRAR